MRASLTGLLLVVTCACSEPMIEQGSFETYDEFENALRDTYSRKPERFDPAYSMIKTSMGVESWLATIHGYPNNLAVCEELIAPYRSDASLSVIDGEYRCERTAR